MPHVGDELHHFGWNACSSCHGDPAQVAPLPDRAGLEVGPHPRDRRRRSARPEDAQGDRARARSPPRPTSARRTRCTACPMGTIMISMLGDADGQCARRIPAARRQVRDRRPLGGQDERPGVQLRLLVSAAAQRDGLAASGPRRTRSASGFDLKDVEAGKYGHSLLFWDWKERKLRQEDRSGPAGDDSARSPLSSQSRQHARLRRRRAVEHDVALVPQGRPVAGRKGDRGRRRSKPRAGRFRCRG